MNHPSLRFVLPLGAENHWSDLLAALVETDPRPISALVGLTCDPADLRVRREEAISRSDRPDLVLMVGDRRAAVIEVKVLAGLGSRQLDRYAEAVPDADFYILIHPAGLAIDLQYAAGWHPVTWEDTLRAYAASDHPWVSATAYGWLDHLEHSLPKVGGGTVWNDFGSEDDFVIALRTRMSWIFAQLAPPPGVDHDLLSSSAGRSWVVRLLARAQIPGYRVVIEVEEKLSPRFYAPLSGADSDKLLGPSIKVLLMQEGVTTSAAFDWEYLHSMWPLMQKARQDWIVNPAMPKAAHDRAGWTSIVNRGAPRFLGIGFGENQTKISRTCMFGARIQLSPASTLNDVVGTLNGLGDLVLQMSTVTPDRIGRSNARG